MGLKTHPGITVSQIDRQSTLAMPALVDRFTDALTM